MKKQLFLFALLVLFSGLTAVGYAQNMQAAKKVSWVPDNGYWVVESNIHTPKHSTVYFYNLSNVLVYKEEVNGVKLKLNKKRTLQNLNTVLQQSLAAWNARGVAGQNELLLAVALKH